MRGVKAVWLIYSKVSMCYKDYFIAIGRFSKHEVCIRVSRVITASELTLRLQLQEYHIQSCISTKYSVALNFSPQTSLNRV